MATGSTGDGSVIAFQNSILQVNAQPSIATTSLPTAYQGLPYSVTLSASGGTPLYKWAAAQAGSNAFPASFVPFTSVVSETGPANNGDRLVLGNSTLSAAAIVNGLPVPTLPGEVFTDASIQLAPGQPFPNVYVPTPAERTGDFSSFPVPLIDPQTGQAFPGNIIPPSRLFGLYAFRVASSRLPAGLTLDALDGVLFGSPTVSGNFNLTVQATDSAGGTSGATIVTATIPLTIVPALVVTSPATLPPAEVTVPYSFTFTASGGTLPYTWTSNPVGGTIPSKLALNAGGVLSGTPFTAATFPFQVTVTDQTPRPGPESAPQSVSLTVNPHVGIATASPLPRGQVGASYSTTLSASPGVGPYTWKLTGGTLPPGLQLALNGTLSGKPTQSNGTSPFSFTLQVTDSFKGTATSPFQLQILPPLPTITVTVPDGITPGSQPSVQIVPSSSFPVDINGVLTLTFNSIPGADDGMIKFVASNTSDPRQLTFTIPANSTNAVSEALQSGTTAGTITVAVTALTTANGPLTALPNPTTIQIAQAAPQIIGPVIATRTAGGELTVTVTGFCTARQVTAANFSFAGGSNLRTHSLPLTVTPMFSNWYQNPASIQTGTQFTLTEPFTINGNPNDVTSVTVVLTGPQGDSQPVTAQIQ